jgi:hypothetical protein
MVGGAVARADAKPSPDLDGAAGTRVAVATADLLSDMVCGLGSKGGWSILVASVAGMWFTTWGVINCRF